MTDNPMHESILCLVKPRWETAGAKAMGDDATSKAMHEGRGRVRRRHNSLTPLIIASGISIVVERCPPFDSKSLSTHPQVGKSERDLAHVFGASLMRRLITAEPANTTIADLRYVPWMCFSRLTALQWRSNLPRLGT